MKRCSVADQDQDRSTSFGYNHTYYRLLSRASIFKIIKASSNEELFATIVADAFVESFVIVGKSIYNKSYHNSLNYIGSVVEFGVCIIRKLVSNKLIILFVITC